ncbi:ATP-dependent zinc metalloproteinase similar to FtsH [Candidatus Syntrophocurvum alkaliphilum]|uniref:ATP-dependent zinc metalloproteinase similar to FtsH n=1 Tax=Candidatus Syntrophocurvum alkaliphilum TaxID=2293317 RepID=A0A6I6DF85_9FIRM|nr:AAA family ATPase [Candidatus Syntrophocurvum alkaliphilum]QGT99642.1 ATP-dependent zinc metalloproteinase similar to FtsH [Candidatus Syntrophocurvum alkaliphilum]
MKKEIATGSGVAGIIFLAILGLNVFPFVLFALLIGGFFYFMMNQGKMKLANVGENIKNTNFMKFEDIGGQDSAINELKEALQFLLKPDNTKKMGIRPLKGVLLVGPPGTGKTLLARAAAGYTSSEYIAASGSEFIEMYAGVGAKRIRQLFSDARKKASNSKNKSAIIFIDELEVLGSKRGGNSSHMEYDQTLNQLLVEMDGINPDDETRILLVGATNRADMLDPALIRPGRFDRQVQVTLPDKSGRSKIFSIHTKNKPLAEDIDIDDIARATFGFSGAQLESLSNEAAILALREDAQKIEHRHFIEAIDKVIMGEKLDRRPSQKEVERVSVHESGHALISELVEEGSVSSLTIVPRGKALGFMRKSSQDDQYLYTRSELEKHIMVALAGAIAEDFKYGNRSTGAKNDFNQAWKVSREIVESGLSSLGVVSIEEVPKEKLYNECKEILVNLEKETEQLLKDNINTLYNISEHLLQEESLDRRAFVKLLNSNNKLAV